MTRTMTVPTGGTALVGVVAVAATTTVLVTVWFTRRRTAAPRSSLDNTTSLGLPDLHEKDGEERSEAQEGHGVPVLLPITSAATLRCCRTLALRDSDVFVCSYPKSGTTWMQAIVVALLSRGAHPAEVHTRYDPASPAPHQPAA